MVRCVLSRHTIIVLPLICTIVSSVSRLNCRVISSLSHIGGPIIRLPQWTLTFVWLNTTCASVISIRSRWNLGLHASILHLSGCHPFLCSDASTNLGTFTCTKLIQVIWRPNGAALGPSEYISFTLRNLWARWKRLLLHGAALDVAWHLNVIDYCLLIWVEVFCSSCARCWTRLLCGIVYFFPELVGGFSHFC